MNPFLDVPQAYSSLIQEEKQQHRALGVVMDWIFQNPI